MFLFLSNTFGQTVDRTYLRHGHNYGTTYSYEVSEIIIHSDSTYTWSSWAMFNKKEWNEYKSYEPEISSGKITRNAEFHALTEYRNGNKSDFYWTVKITDKRLLFYYPKKKGRLEKSSVYRRIK